MLGNRKSSRTNYLLQRDDVGRGKPPTMDLPGEGHTFGAESRPEMIGVNGRKYTLSQLLLMWWAYTSQTN